MLIDPASIDDVCDILGSRPQDVFFVEAHQHLYRAMLKLHTEQTPVDSISVMQALGHRLDSAGGVSYIAGLTSSVPTSANVEHYAKIVKGMSLRRRMIVACASISNDCYSEREDLDDIVGRAQAVFEAIEGGTSTSKTHHIMDVIENVIGDVELFLKSEVMPGVPTPWIWWNNLIGGLPYGEFSMLMARPNVGKTAMMLNIAHTAGQIGIPTLILSLEMDKERLAKRLLNIDSGVDFKRIEKRWQVEPEIDKLKEGAIRVGNMSLWINDTAVQSAGDIRALARKHKQIHGDGLILVDYLQFVNTPRFDKLNIELSDVVKAFARIPKETGHHLLSLGQLSREADSLTTGYDKWNKGAGTSEIEKTADMGFVLHPPKAKEKAVLATTHKCDISTMDDCFQLTLAKNKNGPTGDNYVHFVKERQRFYEMTFGQKEPEVEEVPIRQAEEDPLF